ncbi:MAG: hypothetical protein AAF682_04880 [Planctomycetota bacterium]
MSLWRAANTIVFAALVLFAPAPVLAQDKTGMEEFEEVDPYTRGEPELMDRLGYVSFGPFHWRDGDSTTAVQENMGGVPMLWVETEHFRIGSTLNTYKLSGDADEKTRLKKELARLKEKLGKLKAPKRELDPWLRLHLFAQRAEELYAAFLTDFDLRPQDFSELGPHLGQPHKFPILLCERMSEYSRHMSTYVGVQSETLYRWGWYESCMGFGINVERLRQAWSGGGDIPFDTVLYCRLAASLSINFIDGFRGCFYGAPTWLARAHAHRSVRSIDPRWVNEAGYRDGQNIREDDYKWEPRVQKLVKNDFFAPSMEMFAWKAYADMDVRDHMVAWSRLDYLLDEAEGDRRGFLLDLCQPAPSGDEEQSRALMVARQTKSLSERFEFLPEELDKSWARWVKKTYSKR